MEFIDGPFRFVGGNWKGSLSPFQFHVTIIKLILRNNYQIEVWLINDDPGNINERETLKFLLILKFSVALNAVVFQRVRRVRPSICLGSCQMGMNLVYTGSNVRSICNYHEEAYNYLFYFCKGYLYSPIATTISYGVTFFQFCTLLLRINFVSKSRNIRVQFSPLYNFGHEFAILLSMTKLICLLDFLFVVAGIVVGMQNSEANDIRN